MPPVCRRYLEAPLTVGDGQNPCSIGTRNLGPMDGRLAFFVHHLGIKALDMHPTMRHRQNTPGHQEGGKQGGSMEGHHRVFLPMLTGMSVAARRKFAPTLASPQRTSPEPPGSSGAAPSIHHTMLWSPTMLPSGSRKIPMKPCGEMSVRSLITVPPASGIRESTPSRSPSTFR